MRLLTATLLVLLLGAQTYEARASVRCASVIENHYFLKEGRWYRVPAEKISSSPERHSHPYRHVMLFPKEHYLDFLPVVFSSERLNLRYLGLRSQGQSVLETYELIGHLSLKDGNWVFVINHILKARPKRIFEDSDASVIPLQPIEF